MDLVQKWQFIELFFLGNIGQQNVFYDILERKNSFLGYKKEVQTVNIFPNGLTHGFRRKMAIFPTSFLRPGK